MTRHERIAPPTPRPAYKPSEAAKLMSIGRAWLTLKAAAGEIPGAYRTHGTSGHWRFDPDKFDRYVADLRAGKVKETRAAPAEKKTKRPRRTPKNIEMNDWLADFRKTG